MCPALHLFHPSVGKRRQDTTDQFPISPSKTTPVTSSQSSAAFSSQQSPQNRLPATPLSRQIPIDGPAFTAFPRVLSSEAFGRRPYTGSTARARAGIRNPSGKRSLKLWGAAIPGSGKTPSVSKLGSAGCARVRNTRSVPQACLSFPGRTYNRRLLRRVGRASEEWYSRRSRIPDRNYSRAHYITH